MFRSRALFLIPIGLMIGAVMLAAAPKNRSPTALPPVGSRSYILDASQPFAPVAIGALNHDDEGAKARVLRDPIQPGQLAPASVKASKPLKPLASQPRPSRERPGILRFQKLPVKGHVLQPNVEFSREDFPLERIDEPLTGKFYEKVFAPVTDEAF